MQSFVKGFVGVAFGALAMASQAAPINGSFGFGGGFTPLGGTTADTATGIDFPNPVTGRIGTCGGDYLAIFVLCDPAFGDLVNAVDIPVGTLPNSGGVAYSQVNWLTTATLMFDLNSITSVLRDPLAPTSLRIAGTGTARTTVAGFDATDGIFNVTFNGNGPGSFFFSSSVVTSSVPEPGTLALLGVAALGLGFAWRRRV